MYIAFCNFTLYMVVSSMKSLTVTALVVKNFLDILGKVNMLIVPIEFRSLHILNLV